VICIETRAATFILNLQCTICIVGGQERKEFPRWTEDCRQADQAVIWITLGKLIARELQDPFGDLPAKCRANCLFSKKIPN